MQSSWLNLPNWDAFMSYRCFIIELCRYRPQHCILTIFLVWQEFIPSLYSNLYCTHYCKRHRRICGGNFLILAIFYPPVQITLQTFRIRLCPHDLFWLCVQYSEANWMTKNVISSGFSLMFLKSTGLHLVKLVLEHSLN